jgi:6-phosphogluconate dehydrogenase
MTAQCDIGLIGLAVMGQNLALGQTNSAGPAGLLRLSLL